MSVFKNTLNTMMLVSGLILLVLTALVSWLLVTSGGARAWDYRRPSLADVTSYNYNRSGSYGEKGGGNAFYEWGTSRFHDQESQSDYFGRSGSSVTGHSAFIGINPGLVGGFGGDGGFVSRGPTASPYGGYPTTRGMSGGGGDAFAHDYGPATGGSIPRPDPQAAWHPGAGPTAGMTCHPQVTPNGRVQRACIGPRDGSYVVPEFDTVCWRQNVRALTQDGDKEAYVAALGPQRLVYLCKDYPERSVDVEMVEGGAYLKIVFTGLRLTQVPVTAPAAKPAKTAARGPAIAKD